MSNAFVRGWRQLRFEKRRYGAAALSLTFGVALFFGTLLTAQSIGAQLSDGVKSLGGLADIGIIPTEVGANVSEADVFSLAEMQGVEMAIPILSASTTVRGAEGAGLDRDLMLTGYPTDRYNSLLYGLYAEGSLPSPGGKEVLVPSDIASELGVVLRDTISVASSSGVSKLTVVGIFDPSRMGVMAYDNIFLDLSTAQDIFSKQGELSRIELILSPKFSAEQWQSAFGAKLPEGLQVQDTSALTSTFAPLLATITVVLMVASFVTLGISALLAAIAFSGAVHARRNTYGVMRSVGATGFWLAKSVIIEAFMLSVFCSALGLVVGLGVSWGLNQIFSSVGNLPSSAATVEAWQVCVALAVGILAGAVGALQSIFRVLKQSPITSITSQDIALKRKQNVPWLVGIGLLIIGTSTLFIQQDIVKLLGLGAVLGSAALLAPVIVGFATRFVRMPDWTANVAAQRLSRQRTLGATTAMMTAIVCLSAALAVGVSAISLAMQTQISRQFGADVQVSTSVPVDDEVDAKLKDIAGISIFSSTIAEAGELTTSETSGTNYFLAIDPESYFETAQLPWVQGNDADTPLAMQSGDAIILPEAVAESRGVSKGDEVRLSRGEKSIDLKVVGTYSSLSTGNQAIVTNATAEHLGTSGATNWNVKAHEGQDVALLRDQVEDALASIPGVSVITAVQMKDRAESELGTYSSAAFGMVGLALGLGAIGASGVLALSVTQREREIGLLRAVGVTKHQIRRLISWEVLFVACASSAIGLLMGILAGALLTQIVEATLGVTLSLPLTPSWFAVIAGITIAALYVAAIVPSRRASVVQPISALAAE